MKLFISTVHAYQPEKYLICFAYIGTRFRGIAKTPSQMFDHSIAMTVGEVLDEIDPYMLERNLIFSSRTDAGVHGMQSSASFDVCVPSHVTNDDKEKSVYLASSLNSKFIESKADIRVSQCIRVPDTFNARFDAVSRTYLYRFGVIGQERDFSQTTEFSLDALIPLAELNRTYFVKGPFNVDSAVEACRLLIGRKDFSSFTSKRKNYSRTAIRNLYQVDFKPAEPLMNSEYDPLYTGISFYNIIFGANSFCYRQVRRMVTVILAIGTGELSLEFLQMLINIPGTYHIPGQTAAEYGLYLTNVEYPKEAFDFEEDNSASSKSEDNFDNENK